MSRFAERLEALSQRFSGASWLELWRHLGFVKMLLLALAVFLPLFKYSILPKPSNDELTAELRTLGVSEETAVRVEQASAMARGVRRVKDGFRRLTR